MKASEFDRAFNDGESVTGQLDLATTRRANAKQKRGRADVPVLKTTLHEQANALAYWQAQPYAARLAALEEIRREYHRWRYGAEPRLQRVCRIVRR
jgi:hypothetical protein